MNFLFPFTLLFGLLAPVIAALYLHRPRRRNIEVSSLRFWRAVLEHEPHRRFLGRLRNPLSLLLQLLIFLLLLLALARPEWGRIRGGQSTVVVLDARARMQAGDTFLLARNAALQLVSQAGPDHQVALLAADGSPRILSPFSTDSRGLRESLDTINPSDAGGSLEAPLALAQRLLKGRAGPGKIIVITDRPMPETMISQTVEQILVGTARDNVALLALAHRPLPASPQSEEIFAKLGNFSREDRDVELELAIDERTFDLKKLTLPAGAEKDFSTILPGEIWRGPGAGRLTARLIGDDALPIDNIARATLDTNRTLRVLLLTKNNPFLESALKADPGLDVEILDPAAWRPEMKDGFQAIVFDNWWPEDGDVEDFSRGNFFFFGRSPFEIGSEDVAVSGLKVADPLNPLLWNVDASGLNLRSVRPLRIPDGWRVAIPLEDAGTPLLMALERPGQARIVVTAFRVDSSTFPLRVGFPLFVSNAVHWLAGRDPGENTPLTAGRVFLPAEGERLASEPWNPSEPEDKASLGGTPRRLIRNGFYEVHPAEPGTPSRWIAVNTADRDESDLRQAQANRNTLILRQANFSLQPWQWLALGTLILILIEWALHHRRITE